MRREVYWLIVVGLLLSAATSYAQAIIRGPYLQSGTPSSMVIKWRTDIATTTRVWYGTSPSNLAFTNTVSGTRTDHQVKISGLPANSTFYYAVGNTSGQLTIPGSSYYFRTSPTPGATQTIRAWVLGDCGTSTNNQRAVRDAFYNYIGSSHIDAILMLGDNAYEDGTDAEFQTALFENMYEGRIINSVMWPAIGNHETVTADSPTQTGPYYDIFTLPSNGEAGGTPSGTEAYYSFDYGNVHFIILDSDDTKRTPGSPMLNWLETDLANTTQDWKVAYFHHPPYASTASDLSSQQTQVREYFLPVLEAHSVDLVLVGHVHNYQRSFLINGHYGVSSTFDPATMGINMGDGRLNGDGAYIKTAGNGPGTVYIVTGSAGKKGAIGNPHPVMYSNYAELGSMYMEVTGNQMDLKFINSTGIIRDYFTIVKQGLVGTPPTVSITAPADGTHYLASQAVTIRANASDNDGSVSQVEFFVNNISIGIDNQAPYSATYNMGAQGTFTAIAVARDNNNNTTQSAPIQFTMGPITTCSRVNAGSDDAEERLSGSVNLTSGDLELVYDPGLGDQVVGMRFTGLNIPPGASIMGAYLQFSTDEAVNDNPCNLTIRGQAADNALTFTSSSKNISNRLKTAASVSWSPPDWLSAGSAGAAQKSPNLSYIIQEIVNRPGYTSNSAIALIITGTGRRAAESFEGAAFKAPELCVQYSLTLPDCPALSANIGDPCNDGDNTTVNDVITSNCNCAGTPTACTGIGDADGDGVCANVDCDDNDPGVTIYAGGACNDGNPSTINDVYDANCNCAGVFNTCPGIGDNDGDGICSDVDCNDNDPSNRGTAGEPCNDGDNTTVDDIYGPDCNCAGIPTACTGIGDNDGDGVCDDVDCDDNNPNITTQPGDACNDGNPATFGETIQADCRCGGGSSVPVSTCSTVSSSSDDAEQRTTSGAMDLVSSDLELTLDGVAQAVGMRFNNLNIPQGAYITNAYIQFQVDENVNDDPCNLIITGQASDNAPTFTTTSFNISSRPRTASSVAWSPAHWLVVGEAGAAQRTPNLSAIIQEIVNRSGYTAASSIVLIIDGTGRRTAESANAPDGAPRLCVDYIAPLIVYDCPALQANIGTPCNDGNPATINDVINANCNCAGTFNTCAGIGDADGDGICSNVDCNDNNPNITYQIGSACNDGNPNTVGETIQADCSCGGGSSTPSLTCSMVNASSDDAEEQNGPADLTSSDLELVNDPSLGLQTVGMRFNNLNIPRGAVITNAYIQFTVDEAVNDNPCNLTIYGQASDNAPTFVAVTNNIKGRARTTASVNWQPPSWLTVDVAMPEQRTPNISSIIQEIVNRSGYTVASSIVIIIDGTGRRTAESFNGSPTGAPKLCVEYLSAGNAMQWIGSPTSNLSAENHNPAQGAGGLLPGEISPINIHPNPASDQLSVTFTSAAEGLAQVKIRDLNGKAVLSSQREIGQGENSFTLEGLALPDGVYFLQLFTGSAIQSEKFVIHNY